MDQDSVYLPYSKELRGGMVLFRKDGIVRVELRPKIDLSIPDVDEIADFVGEQGGGKKFPTIITGGKFIRVDREVRRHYSISCQRFSLADAFVTESLPERLLATFYIRFNKPAIPSSLFRNEEEAIRWLIPYVKKEVQ